MMFQRDAERKKQCGKEELGSHSHPDITLVQTVVPKRGLVGIR